MTIKINDNNNKRSMIMIIKVYDNDKINDNNTAVVQYLRVSGQFFFSYQDILHKNKTLKYLNTPKTHNKTHSLGKKCPDKIFDKKNSQ